MYKVTIKQKQVKFLSKKFQMILKFFQTFIEEKRIRKFFSNQILSSTKDYLKNLNYKRECRQLCRKHQRDIFVFDMLIDTLLLVVSFYILMGLEKIDRNHMKQVIWFPCKRLEQSGWNYFDRFKPFLIFFKYFFNI